MRPRAPLVAVMLFVALGCASTLEKVAYPALAESPPAVRSLAVAPFRAEVGPAQGVEERRAFAAQVSTYVADAVVAHGLAVIPPSDMALALQGEAPLSRLDVASAARVASAEFGADALLAGSILRLRKRTGEALGTTQPASVAFEVTLYSAPGGERLWSARFDETQQSLLSNVLNAFRYPGGGTRWLTAEELARWGAREVAEALPVGRAGAGR